MIRKAIPNIIFLVLVNLLVKPVWIFGIDRVVQNELGETTFGLYFTLFNFSMLFQIFTDFGIQNYNSRAISTDASRMKDHLPNLLLGKLGLSVLYFAFTLIAFRLLGYSFAAHGHMLLLLMVNQVLISFIFYLRSNLAGLHRFKLDALFSVLDKVLMILFAGSLLYFDFTGFELTIERFILAQTAAFAINALLLFAVATRLAGPLSFRPDPALIRAILRDSFPFALSIFLMAVYLRMDAIMIERLLPVDGDYAAGLYAQSFRIIDALNMIGILFANILLPVYARSLAEKQSVKKLLAVAAALMAAFVVPVTIAVALHAQWVIELLYVNSPETSGHIFSILIFSFAAYSFMHIFSSLLTAAGQLRTLNLVFGAGILVNFVSNLVLIPKMGAVGAAWTTSVSEWIVLCCIIFLTFRFLRETNLANPA